MHRKLVHHIAGAYLHIKHVNGVTLHARLDGNAGGLCNAEIVLLMYAPTGEVEVRTHRRQVNAVMHLVWI